MHRFALLNLSPDCWENMHAWVLFSKEKHSTTTSWVHYINQHFRTTTLPCCMWRCIQNNYVFWAEKEKRRFSYVFCKAFAGSSIPPSPSLPVLWGIKSPYYNQIWHVIICYNMVTPDSTRASLALGQVPPNNSCHLNSSGYILLPDYST